MSITDELRTSGVYEYAAGNRHFTEKELIAIADRIDAEHEAACAKAYGDGVMSVPIALDENAWVKLPKDADGEYIHVGDVMETFACPAQDYRKLVVYAIAERDVMSTENEFFAFSEIRHYHAPTVEDVLMEFAAKLIERSGLTNGAAQTIAEYAKRLTLVEEEDA